MADKKAKTAVTNAQARVDGLTAEIDGVKLALEIVDK